MTQKNNKIDDLSPSEGPIVEWDQDQWWLDGKTRIKEKNKFLQSKKGKLTILALVFLFVMLLLMLVLQRKPGTTNKEEDINKEAVQEANLTPLQSQIVKLRSQLEKADPAIKETPLPAVEMNIFIEVDKL